MLPRLIGITGKAGAGKDTVADYFVREYGATKYGFADPLKHSLNAMFGWSMELWDDREWKERPLQWLGKSPRQLAQTLGTEWGRETIHPQLWVLLAEQKFIQHIDDYGQDFSALPPFVIKDVRFENEVQMIRSQNGVIIEVVRAGVGAIATHKSEDGLPHSLIDYTVDNNGSIADLCAAADYGVRYYRDHT